MVRICCLSLVLGCFPDTCYTEKEDCADFSGTWISPMMKRSFSVRKNPTASECQTAAPFFPSHRRVWMDVGFKHMDSDHH